MKIMAQLISGLILLIFVVGCSQTDELENQENEYIPTASPTVTSTPSQTPISTFTPSPTVIIRPSDLASVMPLPQESLSWPLATGAYLDVETGHAYHESFTEMQSYTEDGRIGADILIKCGEQPYPDSDLVPMIGSLATIEEHPIYGDATNVYQWFGRDGNYILRFLQDNCYVEITTQRYNNLDPVYEMAEVISERLEKYSDPGALVFPTDVVPMDELRGDRYRELFIHIIPFINVEENSFMVVIDGKEPFMNHVTLGVFDKSSNAFISKMDLYGYPLLTSSGINVSRKQKANPGTDYQLWVWVEDELVFVGNVSWEGWQGHQP